MWQPILIAIIPSILTFVIGWLVAKYNKLKEHHQSEITEQQVYRDSIKYMLRKCLKDDYEFYSKQGYCSLEDKAEVEQCYDLYHNKLKGNGLGTKYYTFIMNLPDNIDM